MDTVEAEQRADLGTGAGGVDPSPGEGPPERGEPRVERWRRRSAGLIILHVFIGLVVVGVLLSSVVAAIMLAVGRQPPAPGTPGTSIAILMGLTGWLLFVYLERSARVRALTFGLVVLAGMVTMFASASGVLVADDFEGTEGSFVQHSDPYVDLSYDRGEYRVLVLDAMHPQFMRSILRQAYPAVRIEATVRFPTGAHKDTYAGVGCWGGPGGYQLVVSPAGEAFLVEVVSEETGERRQLTGGVQTEAWPLEDPVRLRLDCVGGGRGDTAVMGWVANEPVGAVGVPQGLDNWNGPGFVVYATEDGTEVRFDDFSARTDTRSPRELVPPIEMPEMDNG
jgi:hypothetical protein